ncbi:MAG TPA: ERCC4 domain-containing protein [Dehalococcoidia bacterium]|nr:ERCC4 domain-containing protein [Dehalococcoidia bacterium]
MKPAAQRPSVGTWVLERSPDEKFPYRLQIIDNQGRSLVLKAQDRWPAANRNIFCLRENDQTEIQDGEELERVSIIALQRRGIRLSLVLDRGRYKRCDFLFLKKEYKNRPGVTYEQIYWQTQTSMTQRRPTVIPTVLKKKQEFTVRVASDERYPWSFPHCATERGKLAAGDYALIEADNVLAVVERKTLDNLLADFGVMPVLHQRLLELSTYKHNALVVEAPYEDFLNPAKLHHYSASFCAAAIAELYAIHPSLKVVFCSNRKTANMWTQSFFAAVWATKPRS